MFATVRVRTTAPAPQYRNVEINGVSWMTKWDYVLLSERFQCSVGAECAFEMRDFSRLLA
jgi:hypothetical protein